MQDLDAIFATAARGAGEAEGGRSAKLEKRPEQGGGQIQGNQEMKIKEKMKEKKKKK